MKKTQEKAFLDCIRSFPLQFWKAVELGFLWKAPESLWKKNISGVIIAGMGGSGIGGLIAKDLLENKAIVPIIVVQDYSIPKFADNNWLAIIVSYSGNTEETLSVFYEAKKRGMAIVCISSNGILSKECKNCILIPPGFAPRTQLCMTFAPIIATLEKMGLVFAGSSLEKTASFLESISEEAEEDGKKIAKFLHKKIPVIYSQKRFGSAALRFHTQLAENSKTFSHWNVLPELNHNEIVGFLPCEEKLAFVLFRDEKENTRERKRMDFTKKIISEKSQWLELWPKGKSDMEKMFYFILAGDFASYYLALLNGVDPEKVENIEMLKRELKK
ncbi:MAG: bifunctional phosphoglucose/phosphomannose isomerase [Candidatus Diapherotrites archaeon]